MNRKITVRTLTILALMAAYLVALAIYHRDLIGFALEVQGSYNAWFLSMMPEQPNTPMGMLTDFDVLMILMSISVCIIAIGAVVRNAVYPEQSDCDRIDG